MLLGTINGALVHKPLLLMTVKKLVCGRSWKALEYSTSDSFTTTTKSLKKNSEDCLVTLSLVFVFKSNRACIPFNVIIFIFRLNLEEAQMYPPKEKKQNMCTLIYSIEL